MKVFERLAIFFIGIPLALTIVILPYYNYIVLHLAVCVFSFLGSLELYAIFEKKFTLLPKSLVITLTVCLPILSYIFFIFSFPKSSIDFAFLCFSLLILAFTALSQKTFEHVNSGSALSLLVLLYTGYLPTFIVRIHNFNNATYYIALFLIMVFMCDSIAWLFGMTLGKSNRGIIAVSPNKSVMGFIGGYVGSILSAILITHFFKDIYEGMLWQWILIAFVTASASIAGDLVESSFKRSSGVKDSGILMPGRGGILDSIDSILFACPIFYIMLFIILESGK